MSIVQTNERLPWHQSAWRQFEQAIAAQTLPHAWLIHGPQGVGKFHLARQFAQLLLCESPGAKAACDVCRSCKQWHLATHPDYFQLSPEEDKKIINVDGVRRLGEFIYTTRHYAARKVALIHPVQDLNVNAANALLKTLEEPPAATVLILVGTQISRLPATVQSRCRQLPIARPASRVALDWLRQKTTNQATESILGIVLGAPLTALQMLQDETWREREGRWREALPRILQQGSSIITLTESLSDSDELAGFLQWLDMQCRLALKGGLSRSAPEGLLRDLTPLQLLRLADDIQHTQKLLDKTLRWNWQAAGLLYDLKLGQSQPVGAAR